jgi:peroxiredoxin
MSIAIGTEAPSFDLPGVDGRTHSLDEYADVPVLVLMQSCNHCPYVMAWEDRMIAVQRDYSDRGVRLVAVNSNAATTHPADSFDAMIERSRSKGFNFDYLYDEDQRVARALGSERTPEVFAFDRDRRLVYHGSIDDNRDETQVTQHHLREALDAVLEGRDPPVRETPPVGCTVKWKAGP